MSAAEAAPGVLLAGGAARGAEASGTLQARTRVAVCIAAYRRPELLAALLRSLAAQRFAGPAPQVRVIVVDNDAEGSARAPVDAARRETELDVEYVVEPERNISLARNRGVALALAWGAAWIAFVDDDEAAPPGWLAELLRVQARSGADVVCGVVRPRLPPGAPGWAARGGFFVQRQPAAGTRIDYASTNNVLLSAVLVRDGAPFDPALGLTGSEDSLFFLRCGREGARMVAAPDAVVHEWIPPERARARWVLRRAFRVGNAAVVCERRLPRGVRRLGVRVLRSVARLALSAALLPPALLLGRTAAMRALWGVCFGAGSVAALCGYHYGEYNRLRR